MICNVSTHFIDGVLSIPCESALRWMTGHYWWQVNIGSVNGLVPSGTKPLPEPMLANIYIAIWHQYWPADTWSLLSPTTPMQILGDFHHFCFAIFAWYLMDWSGKWQLLVHITEYQNITGVTTVLHWAINKVPLVRKELKKNNYKYILTLSELIKTIPWRKYLIYIYCFLFFCLHQTSCTHNSVLIKNLK